MASAPETDLLPKADRERLRLTVQALHTAQGCALNAAAILIEVATASSPATKTDVITQFIVFRDRFATVCEPIVSTPSLQKAGAKQLKTLKDIRHRFAALGDTEGLMALDPRQCGSIVNFVRLIGVPATMELIGLVRAKQKAHDKASRALTKKRIAQLDHMFTEVEEIGQMIHMISLNASVEASRAGGESGRSFKIIADEIRSLARQASLLIDTTREGVLPGGPDDIAS
ncbi:MAG: methyl-accepting chemotaxis protein [Shimia sp.]